MTRTRRSAFAGAALLLLLLTACTKLERVTVEGVDCVVAKRGKAVQALDCNWPNEDDTNSTDATNPPQ